MNKEENLCALIQDILPVYVDGLVSKETRNTVREHLKECESCQSMYQKMSQQFLAQETLQGDGEILHSVPEIDYLKKVRKRGRRRMLSLALGLVFLFTAGIVWQRYGHGTATEEYSADVTIEGENVKIEGGVKEGKVYADFAIRKKDGNSCLVIYEAEPSFWHREKNFTITLPLEQVEKKELVVAERKISASGEVIETQTLSIYACKHPYIGDAPKNGALAQALGIGEELGNFSNTLQTDEEPYGWQFTFNRILEDGTTDELVFNEKMKGFACVLFACIDNLEEISWSYALKNQSESTDKQEKCGTNEKQETFTAQEASVFLGQDVKGFGENEEKLQELLMLTGVLPGETITPSFSEEYPYRKVLTGTTPNAVSSSTFVVLTKNKDVTFGQVSWSLLSSNSNDWLDDTVIIDMY